MEIYSFDNKANSYCDGEFHFIAGNLEQAVQMAHEFQNRHNKDNPRPAYKIRFGPVERISEIKPGYLPLGRTQ